MVKSERLARALPFIYTGIVGVAVMLFYHANGGTFNMSALRQVQQQEAAVCTQDMALCPDGSYAPRDPVNNCLPKCGVAPTPEGSCLPRPAWCNGAKKRCDSYPIKWCGSPVPSPVSTFKPTIRPLPSFTVYPYKTRLPWASCDPLNEMPCALE